VDDSPVSIVNYVSAFRVLGITTRHRAMVYYRQHDCRNTAGTTWNKAVESEVDELDSDYCTIVQLGQLGGSLVPSKRHVQNTIIAGVAL